MYALSLAPGREDIIVWLVIVTVLCIATAYQFATREQD